MLPELGKVERRQVAVKKETPRGMPREPSPRWTPVYILGTELKSYDPRPSLAPGKSALSVALQYWRPPFAHYADGPLVELISISISHSVLS